MSDEHPSAGGTRSTGRSGRATDDASTGGSQAALPIPEYEVSQYFPKRPTLTDEEHRRLREEYGYVRTFFKLRTDRHRSLQRWLNQGRFGTTYDIYLQWTTYYSFLAALVGILLGYGTAFVLSSFGVFTAIHSPVSVPASGVVNVVVANKTVIGTVLVTLLFGVGFALAVWGVRYYYPRLVVGNRRRNISFLLPNAIVMMFALSEGGMTLAEVLRHVADADDAYDEVANEFETVMRDVDMFGSDLYTALRNLRNLTPSSDLEQFLDDLINVVESGGDVTSFFEEQSSRYLQQAADAQEDFLELLSVLSEVFVVAFVAAPLFLVVILLIISVLGGSQLLQLMLVVYVIIPLGMAGYLVLVSTLSEPFVYPETRLNIRSEDGDIDDDTASVAAEHPSYEQYAKTQRYLNVKAFLSDPLQAIRRSPRLVLLFSVPVAAVWVFAYVTSGGAPTSFESLVAFPITGTTNLFVVPFLIAFAPLSFFHELKRGREQEVSKRFPETLNILSSANNMGIPLSDALDIIARWSGGWFALELHRLRNDVQWNMDLRTALLRFANRLRVPQVALTLKLIAEAIGSTQDLSKVLRVAAEDTRNRFRLERNRRRAMSSYIVVVVVGYLVYLLVVLLLDASFLEPIGAISATASTPDSPVSLQGIPVNTYRLLFYHSVLIQALGCGLLTGELGDSDAQTGLKYSLLLIVIATAVFQLV